MVFHPFKVEVDVRFPVVSSIFYLLQLCILLELILDHVCRPGGLPDMTKVRGISFYFGVLGNLAQPKK